MNQAFVVVDVANDLEDKAYFDECGEIAGLPYSFAHGKKISEEKRTQREGRTFSKLSRNER